MFLSEINNFQMTEIASDYHKSIDLLMTQYAKHTLIDLIASSNLEILIPMILKDSAAQKSMAYFIKSQFSQAVLTVQSTGQKAILKELKNHLRKLFKFCASNATYSSFLQEFINEHVIRSGISTIEQLAKEKSRDVKTHFDTEEKNLVDLNPYLLKFMTTLLIEIKPKFLLE